MHNPRQAVKKRVVWRPSIRFYLIMMNFVLLCLLFPAVGVLFLHQESKFLDTQLHRSTNQMQQALENRSATLVRNMALSAGYAVAGYDFSFLNNLVHQVIVEDREITYCIIMDTKGKAVAHSDPEKVGSILNDDRDQQAAALLTGEFPLTLPQGQQPQVRFITESMNSENEHPAVMESLAPIYSGAKLYAVLRCGYSLERLSLEILTAKQDWAQRSHQVKIYLASVTGLFFSIGVIIAALFTRTFVRSMQVVSIGVSRVAQGDLDQRIQPGGLVCAEIFQLSKAFNAMTGQLKVSRRQVDEYSKSLEHKVAARTKELKDAQANLLQQAHEAGMAEMAVGMLHNIGNAITPAKVGLFRLFGRMGERPLLRLLPTALAEVEETLSTHPTLSSQQKKRLHSIINLVPAAIKEEYILNSNEIEQVRHKLNHIENIIGLQMRYTQLVGDIEDVEIPLVVEDALSLLEDALNRRSVRVTRDFSQVPPVRIEKAKLIQIVVNLIKNSYEAMDKVVATERSLSLSIRFQQGPPDYVVLSIRDNGVGFSAEEKEKLFTFGFSTKPRGSGFGLHSCANYLIARNGLISAHSDGPGKGAEFIAHLAVNETNSLQGGE